MGASWLPVQLSIVLNKLAGSSIAAPSQHLQNSEMDTYMGNSVTTMYSERQLRMHHIISQSDKSVDLSQNTIDTYLLS